MNKVIISGNLCFDLELKATTTGKEVLTNTVAVRRDYKEQDGNYVTDFIDIVCWGVQAKYLSSYGNKGDRVEVVGRWQNRSYDNTQGQTITKCEVIVENIQVFSRNDNKQEEKPTVENDNKNSFYDDLPF